MTSRILLLCLAAAAAFSSCSSVYKAKQTPDDVYYSPARETDSYVRVEKEDDRRYNNSYDRNSYDRSYDYYDADDRWLRMRVRNRYRWSAFDDYAWNDWRYNTWSSNYYNPWNHSWNSNSYWNNYYNWNSYYNPYCRRVIVVNPKTNPVVYDKVRNFGLSSYSNPAYNNTNVNRGKGVTRGTYNSGYNNTNSSSYNNQNSSGRRRSSGNVGGKDSYYTPSSSSSSNDRPVRTYTPSSSSSSSSSSGTRSSGSSGSGSSGGSSGGGSGSRPSRGGN